MQEIYLPKIEQKYDFNEGFEFCCKTLRKRVRKDYDATIAITGDEGISKSTCANQIGFKTDKNYDLEKNVLYSPNRKNMEDKIRNLPRFSAVNGDEAIKILYKLRWYSPLQVFINVFYRLCRQENKISIFCMPRFKDFNEGFRNHRILLWIHLLDRGFGIAFQKDWSPFASDPWWFKENQKIVEKYRRRKVLGMSLEDKVKILQKSPNFLDIITFPDLPEELRIKYKTLSSQHKYEGLGEEYEAGVRYTKLKDKYQGWLRNAIICLKNQGFSQKQIAQTIQISETSVSRMLRKSPEAVSLSVSPEAVSLSVP